MKKITVALNKNSINKAIKQVVEHGNLLQKATSEYYVLVAQWIIRRANEYINRSDVGREVKDYISTSWHIFLTKNGAKVVNTSQKAVFVEFGVGVVGESSAHPMASTEGYRYNVDSRFKDRKGSGTWLFKCSVDGLDIPLENAELIEDEDDDEYVVVTQGAKGVWYAYNAIVDAKMELSKPNGGEIGLLWEQAKRRYFT